MNGVFTTLPAFWMDLILIKAFAIRGSLRLDIITSGRTYLRRKPKPALWSWSNHDDRAL